jgi:hypothetical protein
MIEKTVVGIHFVQEDSPHEIGRGDRGLDLRLSREKTVGITGEANG